MKSQVGKKIYIFFFVVTFIIFISLLSSLHTLVAFVYIFWLHLRVIYERSLWQKNVLLNNFFFPLSPFHSSLYEMIFFLSLTNTKVDWSGHPKKKKICGQKMKGRKKMRQKKRKNGKDIKSRKNCIEMDHSFFHFVEHTYTTWHTFFS